MTSTINVYVNGDGDPSEIAESVATAVRSVTQVTKGEPLPFLQRRLDSAGRTSESTDGVNWKLVDDPLGRPAPYGDAPLSDGDEADLREKLAKVTNDWNLVTSINGGLANKIRELESANSNLIGRVEYLQDLDKQSAEEEKRLNEQLRRTTEKLIELRQAHGDERPVGGSSEPVTGLSVVESMDAEVRAVEMVEAAAVRAEEAEGEEVSATEPLGEPEIKIKSHGFTFDLRGDEDDPLATVITQGMGYASGCWENLRGAGVFESDLARDAAEKVIAWVKEQYGDLRIEVASSKPRVKLPTSVDPSYSVEVGGERFSAQQWEALQPYIAGRIAAGDYMNDVDETANPDRPGLDDFRTALLDYLGYDKPDVSGIPADADLIRKFRDHFGVAKNPEAGK